MRKLPLIALVISVFSTNAHAEWISLSSDAIKTVYADPSTIVRHDDLVEMWGIFDFKTTHISDQQQSYKSLKFHDEYDCNKKLKRNLTISVHPENLGQGELLASYADPSKWITASGTSALLWKIACGIKD
jgi:hypothetical protein